jgi:hypothetical protein
MSFELTETLSAKSLSENDKKRQKALIGRKKGNRWKF